MKCLHLTCLFFVLLTCSGYVSKAQSGQLIWADEFNYTGSPNAASWNMENWPAGYVNGEAQAYTSRPENARVENGNLIIEARREAYNGAAWTSARIQTMKKQDLLYGRIEVRAKLPAGQGTWPAIWTLPSDWVYGDWPVCGEIDIMEHSYSHLGEVHGTLHTGNNNWTKNNQITAAYPVADFSTAYHVYALEWTPTTIKISVDNNVYLTFQKQGDYMSWPFDKPNYLILNLAMGGGYGGRIAKNLSSARMFVDYVRMYSFPEYVDTEAPSAPLSLSGFSASPSVNLSWNPSTDNFSVKEYEVYQGETLVGSTIWHKYFIDNLQPFTNYSFKVRAVDYSGNYSPFATTQVTTIGASVPVVNPAFEVDGATQTPTGWSEAFTTTASYTEGGGRSGNKLVHYSATKFKVSTFQTITGLQNGTYTLSAYYMGGGGNVQMIAKNSGGTTYSMSLGTASNVWVQKKLDNIVVSNGQITIEFLSDFSTNRNGGWLFIEDVSLSQVSAAARIATVAPASGQETAEIPTRTAGPFPNPFTHKVTIPVQVTQRGIVDVKIFSASGALVRHFTPRELEAGTHQFVWDGNSVDGITARQGIYIYKVTANGKTYTGKLMKEK